MAFTISSGFDSGNIRVNSIEGQTAMLEIRKDKDSDFFQWFHFRVAGAKGKQITLKITNCGSSAYPDGWQNYKARYSTDRQAWHQESATRYEAGTLTIEHTCTSDIVWFAYFAPYSMERHHDLVARMAAVPGVTHLELGYSIEGQPIDCLRIGSGPKHVWLYGRQHPGETMAEWWMEGALELLTNTENATAHALRSACTFHIVPNMNPDGSCRGHLRTNAVGANLNREWETPTKERSPEVLCVLEAMKRTGVHFAIDVHGDEAIPANFLAGFEGIPKWQENLGATFRRYRSKLTAQTPDFQETLGYPESEPGTANLTMSTNQVANRFGCVAMTLEMPFKDHDANPLPSQGWNPARSKALAQDCLIVLHGMLDQV